MSIVLTRGDWVGLVVAFIAQSGILGYLVVKGSGLLSSWLGLKKFEQLHTFAHNAVLWAEQVGARNGWTSQQKLEQVLTSVALFANSKGVPITPDQIRVLVESSVKAIHDADAQNDAYVANAGTPPVTVQAATVTIPSSDPTATAVPLSVPADSPQASPVPTP